MYEFKHQTGMLSTQQVYLMLNGAFKNFSTLVYYVIGIEVMQ
jgi:hypothetical protein